MLRFVLKLLGLLAAGAFGLAGFAAYRLNHSPRRDLLDEYFITPFELGVPYREVRFWTDDLHELRGWFFEQADTDRVLVGLTGRQVAKDSLIGIGTGLWRAGFNVLIFDFRGRGESDPGHQTVGHTEARDAAAALEFARRTVPGARVGLFGFSMGGALALMATADDPGVEAVMADSAFAALPDLVAAAFGAWGLPGRLLARLTGLLNRLWYGYDLDAVRPLDKIAAIAPRPLMLIHGGRDRTVPLEQNQLLVAEAGAQPEVWIEDDCEHCGVYFKDRPAYIARVADFFQRGMPPGKAPRAK